jgi:organic hydroperoxide reductase OsmC/OhrA
MTGAVESEAMSTHHAEVTWQRQDHVPLGQQYSRAHWWQFDGGAAVRASSSPAVVPEPYSDASAVDPEEAFVAGLSSCHMLWFLSLAAQAGHTVLRYRDAAQGVMQNDGAGEQWISTVVLSPDVVFSKDTVLDQRGFDALHHRAHAKCFLANSVKSTIQIDATFRFEDR